MTSIESKKTNINSNCEAVYNFLSNFNNFRNLVPDQISNWESSENYCSFTISSLSDFKLRIVEKIPFSKIMIISDTEIPFSFNIICFLEDAADKAKCTAKIAVNAELSPMLSMFATKPLQTFVDTLALKLSEYFK